jgi:hypothetical protein
MDACGYVRFQNELCNITLTHCDTANFAQASLSAHDTRSSMACLLQPIQCVPFRLSYFLLSPFPDSIPFPLPCPSVVFLLA